MSDPSPRQGMAVRRWQGWILAGFLVASGTLQALGAEPDLEICDAAALRSARETGVPLAILETITRVETGRTLAGAMTAWPWTVNIAGRGYWFDNREDALAFVIRHHKAGARSFDIGCFQVNYRWHGAAFGSLREMFEPYGNALYAARFLSALRDETGSWARAVGFYHSRSPHLAQAYRARFDRMRAKLDPPIQNTAPGAALPDVIRVTSGSVFPLSITVADAALGGRESRRVHPGALMLILGAEPRRYDGM